MASTELLKIEGFQTKEIALSQKPINEVLKESEGVLISFTKSDVKKKLSALVKKHEKEINELIAKDQLTTKEETRLKELRQIHKEPRIALDKITKHNSSVLAQASKSSKVVKDELTLIVEPIETKITERLDNEDKRREKARIEKENAENERKEKLQKIVNVVAADLQKVIDFTDTYSKVEESLKQFNSIIEIFNNSVEEKQVDLQEFDLVYQSMVDEKSEQFDLSIKNLKTAYDLEQSNKALEVQRLTNERMIELFDYNFKYKGEKALGELSIEDFISVKLEARKSFRIEKIEAIGLTLVRIADTWIYADEKDIIIVSINLEEVNSISDEDFNKKLEFFKSEIEESKNQKPIEEVIELPMIESENEVKVNDIEVDLTTENSNDFEAEELKENKVIEESEKHTELNENSTSLETNQTFDRYQELFDYLSNELSVLALLSQMQDIETIVLKMQE